MIPPIIFAILTGFILFVHSDTNIAMLYSQCHARARLPFISKTIPLLGTPICFLVSFFQEAVASAHKTMPLMAGVLSFIGDQNVGLVADAGGLDHANGQETTYE